MNFGGTQNLVPSTSFCTSALKWPAILSHKPYQRENCQKLKEVHSTFTSSLHNSSFLTFRRVKLLLGSCWAWKFAPDFLLPLSSMFTTVRESVVYQGRLGRKIHGEILTSAAYPPSFCAIQCSPIINTPFTLNIENGCKQVTTVLRLTATQDRKLSKEIANVAALPLENLHWKASASPKLQSSTAVFLNHFFFSYFQIFNWQFRLCISHSKCTVWCFYIKMHCVIIIKIKLTHLSPPMLYFNSAELVCLTTEGLCSSINLSLCLLSLQCRQQLFYSLFL